MITHDNHEAVGTELRQFYLDLADRYLACFVNKRQAYVALGVDYSSFSCMETGSLKHLLKMYKLIMESGELDE